MNGIRIAVVCLFASSLSAQENPREIHLGVGTTKVQTLKQNWSDEESNWFYSVPQGSRLLPYEWFLHLEQPKSTKRFRNANHIRALGYIPRQRSPQNPDALPIGIVKDAAYEDGTAGMGFTCAACHTAQINYRGTALLIDGAPAMGDLERFLKSLSGALRATADNDAKFQRFAAAVLPSNATDDQKGELRSVVRIVADQREAYNKRNLPEQARKRFGPGRVDAFGAILNEVTVRFLNVPQNRHPADAPVSYPCLWDAPQHDFVQWNGAAENRKSPLGPLVFGTTDVGALGRNAGEVLGVFGHAEINEHELLVPRRYASSVNKPNLIKIENSLKTLWSPKWPEDVFGKIDSEARQRGQILYKTNCSRCHAVLDRTAANREVKAVLRDVGTDQTMIQNFARTAKTGKLKRRRTTLLGRDRLAETEARGVILKHVVERVILDPKFKRSQLKQALAGNPELQNTREAMDSLNPGYKTTASILLGDRKLVGQLDTIESSENAVQVGGGRFQLQADRRENATEAANDPILDLRSPESTRAAAERIEGIPKPEAGIESLLIEQAYKVRLPNAQVEFHYKARPLNGIWATAPYLHNGSVPNLQELLQPADQRLKTFHVGGREFDPVNVGFVDDPDQPLFDTQVKGNANTGHEFGGDLSPQERKDLLEYLKSL